MAETVKQRRKFLKAQIARIDKSIELREAVLLDQRNMRQRHQDELDALPEA